MAQTKQQKEVGALIGLLFVAAVIWLGFFSKNSPGGIGPLVGPYTPIAAEDYGKPVRQLADTRGTEYKPSGRNIFIAAPPAPPPAAHQDPLPEPYRPTGPMPDPPPPPPTLDMKFFGLGTFEGGPRRAFLQDGEEVRIVGEGDIIKNRIRITHIGNDRIEYQDTNTGAKNSTVLEMPPQT